VTEIVECLCGLPEVLPMVRLTVWQPGCMVWALVQTEKAHFRFFSQSELIFRGFWGFQDSFENEMQEHRK